MESVQVKNALLVVPHADEGAAHPGGIRPGYYTRNQVVAVLREHKDDADAIQFIADMLEE